MRNTIVLRMSMRKALYRSNLGKNQLRPVASSREVSEGVLNDRSAHIGAMNLP